MHGTGMHHHVHRMREWKLVQYIRELIARITGHADREKLKIIFDKVISVVGLIGPIMTIPQIFTIWAHHQVEGLALASWSTYIFTSSFWLLYGIVHRERAIIIANIAWFLANTSIVVGILVFR